MKEGIFLFLILCSIAPGVFDEKNYPSHFPDPVHSSTFDKSKFELGRALFYDPILSRDSSISCASCHSPFNAFAHTDHDLSHGIDDRIGTRNAPALMNLAWQENFMWDGSVKHLHAQALIPIEDEREMDQDLEVLLFKLKNSELYEKLFMASYDDPAISIPNMLNALEHFQLQLISSNSKYDQVQQGLATFNMQEKKGHELFKLHCNSCHTEPLFSNYELRTNNLPIDTTLNDYGHMSFSKKPSDSLLFKVPSLRNLSYSFPYMHDGRFQNLNEVLDHYRKNVLQELNPNSKFSSNDIVDLKTFLLTLNDKEFVFNKELRYPIQTFKP
ncbi:MAG: cytochrome-c peroxidase [Bacteroidota bacterium]